MTKISKSIALGTAMMMGALALAPGAQAASPIASAGKAPFAIESGIVKIGGPGGPGGFATPPKGPGPGPHGHGHGHGNGWNQAAPFIGLGAFALGAAIASSRRSECVIERTREWSHRHQAMIIREEKVCY
ncbi:hypothetical protein [Acuticoccus kandeliae]|uniref:hypothetical protein n=1 Tax=Acuticoccus kandeliae TaxID=2073160 RepID=UPI000D3E3980|nr:hypothetical protein [Acuticoccus kandeliae]